MSFGLFSVTRAGLFLWTLLRVFTLDSSGFILTLFGLFEFYFSGCFSVSSVAIFKFIADVSGFIDWPLPDSSLFTPKYVPGKPSLASPESFTELCCVTSCT